MALTASQLYNAAALEPTQLDEDIVSPSLNDAAKKAAAIDYLESDVLPGALAEVAIPLRHATGYGSITALIAGTYPDATAEVQAALVAEGEPLFDAAVKSYGRSEINKLIDSNDASYDRDSDQDRIQGNQRLEKLLQWAALMVAGDGASGSASNDNESIGVDVEVGW